MYKKILVPLDGSELAEKILSHAEELAKVSAGEVTFLRVVHPDIVAGPIASGGEIQKAFMEEAVRAEAYLEEIAKTFADKGIQTDTIVLQGDAATRIIDYAQGNNFDIICMTTHGRSGVSRWVMGSVVEKVTRGTQKPVLLVRGLTVVTRHIIDEQEIFALK